MYTISLCWRALLQGAASLAARQHLPTDPTDYLATGSHPAFSAWWGFEPTLPAVPPSPGCWWRDLTATWGSEQSAAAAGQQLGCWQLGCWQLLGRLEQASWEEVSQAARDAMLACQSWQTAENKALVWTKTGQNQIISSSVNLDGSIWKCHRQRYKVTPGIPSKLWTGGASGDRGGGRLIPPCVPFLPSSTGHSGQPSGTGKTVAPGEMQQLEKCHSKISKNLLPFDFGPKPNFKQNTYVGLTYVFCFLIE